MSTVVVVLEETSGSLLFFEQAYLVIKIPDKLRIPLLGGNPSSLTKLPNQMESILFVNCRCCFRRD
ncbi:hypothetical protein SUB0624 [Streptococcus uberis 0140J]|uniref:Uncharacterized protein n=1 Tax=Streptococcus uberis (strain ATCC BAA-854 / 0140J) TaxID=218495 RepID=B9DRN9_STRU0|nr:hypothetical protein SUB0624 [Streptococcus uberis 0140J]